MYLCLARATFVNWDNEFSLFTLTRNRCRDEIHMNVCTIIKPHHKHEDNRSYIAYKNSEKVEREHLEAGVGG